MSDHVRVRRGSRRDGVTIAALATQVFLDTYATRGVRPDLAREAFGEYSEAAFAARLAQPSREFIVAEIDDALVGFAEILCADVPCPSAGITGAELVRLYVQPQAQRGGIGGRLISTSESLASTHSLAHLWLTVWDGNANALAFYDRLGYADVGATTYTFEGHACGNRVLAKRLLAP